ncbi:MAG: glycosyltransferase [Candidatus Acidiferrales bacterium]
MKIVLLTRFEKGDGAANCAQRVHRGLLRLGHDSRIFVAERKSNEVDPTITVFRPPQDLPSKLKRRWRDFQIQWSAAPYRRTRPAGYEAFSDDRSRYHEELLEQIPPCDVLHIQQMYQLVDYHTFFSEMPKRVPIVRTLHDASFFAGGCHSPEGCSKYAEQCGGCPQLGSKNPRDLSNQIWQRKSSVFRNIPAGRLAIVTPSHWLMEEAKRSSLLRGFPIVRIPIGINTEVFRPRDKNFARDILSIPPDARVVLFVAEPITRSIKNFSPLAEALESLDVPNLLLVSAGGGKPSKEVRVPYLSLGSIQNERLLSLAYTAADVFVLPSRQESFGLSIVEAIACGTPAVGFAVGGIPDIIRTGITGVLVPPQDFAALRAAISGLLKNPKSADLAGSCRSVAVEEYSLDVMAKRHVQLYESMIARH